MTFLANNSTINSYFFLINSSNHCNINDKNDAISLKGNVQRILTETLCTKRPTKQLKSQITNELRRVCIKAGAQPISIQSQSSEQKIKRLEQVIDVNQKSSPTPHTEVRLSVNFPNKDDQELTVTNIIFDTECFKYPVRLYNGFAKISPLDVLSLRDDDWNNSDLLIKTGHRGSILGEPVTDAELKARTLLRDFITELEWRRYITSGFIMVCGGITGLWYQISASPNQKIIRYANNKKDGVFCIHSRNVPPSDHVLSMKFLIENDEMTFINESNYYRRANS